MFFQSSIQDHPATLVSITTRTCWKVGSPRVLRANNLISTTFSRLFWLQTGSLTLKMQRKTNLSPKTLMYSVRGRYLCLGQEKRRGKILTICRSFYPPKTLTSLRLYLKISEIEQSLPSIAGGLTVWFYRNVIDAGLKSLNKLSRLIWWPSEEKGEAWWLMSIRTLLLYWSKMNDGNYNGKVVWQFSLSRQVRLISDFASVNWPRKTRNQVSAFNNAISCRPSRVICGDRCYSVPNLLFFSKENVVKKPGNCVIKKTPNGKQEAISVLRA